MNIPHDTLLKHRIILLSEEINTEVANHVISNLLLLDAEDQHKQIDIYINSPGGSVIDGLAIIDVMRCIQAPIHTICFGSAASMGAWILAAGTKGFRRATPNSEIMIHQLFTGMIGKVSHLKVHIDHTLQLHEKLVTLFHEFTGQDTEKIKRDIEKDFFMTPEQAKEYGIIDEIIPHIKKN